MWVINGGKQATPITCSNYQCMCQFVILKGEIKRSYDGKWQFVKCPMCGKTLILIDVEVEE